MPKTTTPKDEEKQAKQNIANLEKARIARTKAARKRKWDDIWPGIQRIVKATDCTCGLKKGMTDKQIKDLGGGCTDTLERSFIAGNGQGRWVCPALDQLRRLLYGSNP